jgi:hypothetical protein
MVICCCNNSGSVLVGVNTDGDAVDDDERVWWYLSGITTGMTDTGGLDDELPIAAEEAFNDDDNDDGNDDDNEEDGKADVG